MRNFFSFEGGEGCGKSTQAKLLYKSFKKVYHDTILTREPGGTELSEILRKLIVKEKYSWNPLTELLLINAARNEHIQSLILPSLKQKKILITDRFLDSTFTYQIIGKKLNKAYFKQLNDIVIKKIIPETTFLIDINPKIGIKRSLSRKNNETKFEKLNINFHNKIRDSFLLLAKSQKKRFIVIDGLKSVKKIHEKIVDFINLKKKFKYKLPYVNF